MKISPLQTIIFLSLLGGLLLPSLSQADVWRCPRPDGTDLYTDRLKDPATCEKYELKTELGYASGPPRRDPVPTIRVPEESGQVEAPPYPEDRRHPPGKPFYPSEEGGYYDDIQAYDDYEEYYPYTGYAPGLYWFSNKPGLLKPKPHKVVPVPSTPMIVPPTVRPFPDLPQQSIGPAPRPRSSQRR